MTDETTAADLAEKPAEEPVVDEAAAAEPEPAPETPAPVAEEPLPEPEPAPVAARATPDAEPATEVAEPAGDAVGEAEPAVAAPAEDSKKKWYVIKVQSGREESIKGAIERKVKIEGLEEFFGEVLIPYEEFVEKKSVRAKVKNKKTGEVETVTQEKNVVKKRKKFHGYIFANVEFNDRILYLFRETSGVGDFVGGGGPMKPPAPMAEIEVRKMLGESTAGDKPLKKLVKLDFEKGDRVRVKDGAFSGSEAEVKAITMPKDPTDTPKVTVVVTIWGRPVEMEMDYWHVEKL
jgi:transcriptional antiterminator NusG